MEYTDGTYKHLGDGQFERYDREALGYWVSSTSYTPSDTMNPLDALRIVQEMTGAKYLGIWTADDGTRYVDKSHYTTDRELAEAAGRHWNQIAIWDIAKGEPIIL